jgi:hypothetical protein
MKLLSRGQITRRLLVFGFVAVAFAVAIVAVQLTLGADSPVTGWTLLTGALGLWALIAAVRWQGAAHHAQSEWQPRLFLQTLNGGFAYQAGVIGYFVGNDLTAVIVGLAAFAGVLMTVLRAMGSLEYETP